MDSELVCRLVMLWQLSVSLLPADELLAGQGRALEGRERPEAGLEAGESVHMSGVLPYSGLLPPLRPPRLPVPEEGESRLACLASVPWGLPSNDGHLPESGVPGELALELALVPNNLRKVGEAMSGYLDPGCLRLDWPAELVGLDLGEVDSVVAESWSETVTFSLSVWFTLIGLERSELTFPASLRLVAD